MIRTIERCSLDLGILLLLCASFMNFAHGSHLPSKYIAGELHHELSGVYSGENVREEYKANGKEIIHPVGELDNFEQVNNADLKTIDKSKDVEEESRAVNDDGSVSRVNKDDFVEPTSKPDSVTSVTQSGHGKPVNKAENAPAACRPEVASPADKVAPPVSKVENAEPIIEAISGSRANNNNDIEATKKAEIVQPGDKSDIEAMRKAEALEMDVFVKRVIGTDNIVADLRRPPTIPSYVMMLYDAVEDGLTDVSNVEGETDNIPTIRTVKPYSMRSKFWYIFKLKTLNKRTHRLEIVLKLGEKSVGESRDDDDPYIISVFTSEQGWRYYEGQRFEEFIIVNISNVLKDEDKTIAISRNLRVGEHRRRISRRLEPILVAYENKNSNPLFRVRNRVRRNQPEAGIVGATPVSDGGGVPSHHISSFEQQAGTQRMVGADYYHCRRYDWTINMRIFNWNWYAFPATLNAGFCSGHCPFPLDVPSLNSTNHSFLKNRWRVSSHGLDESVPGECCTPVSYLPASIIYLSSSMEYVMREMPNMRVNGCGCR